MAGLLEAARRPMAIGCGFETIKTIWINMTKRPSTTTGARKGSGGKPAAGKAKKATKAGADDEDEDGSEEAEAGRPQLSEAEQAEADAAEIEESAPVDKKIEELNETGDEDEDPEELERLKRKYMVLRFWQTAKRFWTDPHSDVAWALTGAVLGGDPAQSRCRLRDERLESQHLRRAGKEGRRRGPHAVRVYVVILVISVLFAVVQVYARMTLQRRWRQWLTDILVDRWLKNGRYYQLNLISGDHKNPEYRIADDVRIATESPVDFVSGVTSAFPVGGHLHRRAVDHRRRAQPHHRRHRVDIPGFLVIAAVLYAVIASGAMMLIGRRFVTVSEEKNQTEAEFRYVLTRLRENGESIALIQGEEEERAGVDRALRHRAAGVALDLLPDMKTTVVSSQLRLHRAGPADHPVRAEIPRRHDDARPSDAGGVGLHHRAGRLQLAGRQLSAARRLDRVGAARRLADGVARRAGARRERRRRRPHRAHQRRRRRGAASAATCR